MKVTFDIFSTALAPVRARFSALVPREQFMVRVAASLIGLTLLWSVVVDQQKAYQLYCKN